MGKQAKIQKTAASAARGSCLHCFAADSQSMNVPCPVPNWCPRVQVILTNIRQISAQHDRSEGSPYPALDCYDADSGSRS